MLLCHCHLPSTGHGQSARLSPDYLAAVRSMSDLQQLQGLPTTLPFNPDSPQGQLPQSHPGSTAPTYAVAKALMNRYVGSLQPSHAMHTSAGQYYSGHTGRVVMDMQFSGSPKLVITARQAALTKHGIHRSSGRQCTDVLAWPEACGHKT